MNRTVCVFGSSKPKPGEKDYVTAYEVGKELARAYRFLMSAVQLSTTVTGAPPDSSEMVLIRKRCPSALAAKGATVASETWRPLDPPAISNRGLRAGASER